MNRYKILTILFFTFFCLVYTQQIVVKPINIKDGTLVQHSSALSILENTKKTFRTFYENKELIFWSDKIKISSTKKYIGTIAQIRGKYRDSDNADFTRYDLIILDVGGTLIKRIANVCLFDWSPAGSQIVYATGKKYSDKDSPTTDELFVFDLTSNKISTIGKTTTTELQWAPFDSNIYINQDGQVHIIFPKTWNSKATIFHGLHFSPDGKFYIAKNMESNTIRIYERDSNLDVTEKILGKETLSANFIEWTADDRYLVVGDITYSKKIINLQNFSLQTTVVGEMLGYDFEKKEILIYKDRRWFRDISTSKVEKINLETN